MKKFRNTWVFAALLAVIARGNTGESVVIASGPVEISEPVSNDTFILGDKVSLSGTFSDDVWAGGREVRFTGQADDDLRLGAAEVLIIDGPVGGDLKAISIAGNMLLTTNTVVGASTYLRGEKQVTVNGLFTGDVYISAPKVVMDAHIEGSLTLDAIEIRLLPGTRIDGDLTTMGETSFPLPSDVELGGEQKQATPTSNELDVWLSRIKYHLLAAQFISAFLTGVLMIRLVPRFMGQSVDHLLQLKGPCFTLGSLTLAIGGIAGYLLLFSGYASGAGVFLLSVTGLFFYLGKIVLALALGARLLKAGDGFTFKRLVLALLIGLVTLYLIFSIAFIGTTLYILLSCWGMGALILSIRNSQRVITQSIPPNLKNTNPSPEEEN